MKISSFLLLSFVFLLSTGSGKRRVTEPEIPAGFCISAEETSLYNLINTYRISRNLPEIPLSASLSYVARMHVYDLDSNYKDNGRCNMHSWSNKGRWKGCCYTSNHAKAECIWNKPRELTGYSGNGYEIACSSTARLTPAESLQCWKESPAHNALLMSSGEWKKHPWKAMGVGIYNGYAVVWFGEIPDTAPVRKCN